MRRSYKRVKHSISIREPIYEQLKALAQKNGEHISTTLDGIVLAYLDAKVPKS